MRLLLDECIPHRFARLVTTVPVSTVADEGWRGLRNGALLRVLREAGYTHLITVDRNLAFQQHVAAAGIGVVVLRARTNRLSDLTPLLPALLETLPRVGPGQVAHVGV